MNGHEPGNNQEYYISQIRSLNERRSAETGGRPLALVKTFGCQMNAHDSEKIETMLRRMGYGRTDSEKNADLALLNTCCVRKNAENHAYGNLGLLTHVKKMRRDMRIVLCGCMTQRDDILEKIVRSYRLVDVVFGTFNLLRFPELLYTNLLTGRQVIEITHEPEEPGKEYEKEYDKKYEIKNKIEKTQFNGRHFAFKASVNIMYGCNNYCSYCIVPYVRGRERSRPADTILEEIRMLADDGVKEIMLLGQNVNSYGLGLQEGLRFAGLLEQICQVSGIERIRFMTSHPKDLSDDLIGVMQRQEKICKHLHLPIQSGSTNVLKRMNRNYTKEDYLHLAEKFRAVIPEIALTTDIIVGFPGETEEDFAETLDVVQKARFASAFTFLYSKRTGTPAADMEGQVPPEIAGERFQKLLAVLNPIVLAENEKWVSRTLRVLPEEINTQDERLLTGRADSGVIVHFRADESRIGVFTDVKITGCKTFYLLGEAVYD